MEKQNLELPKTGIEIMEEDQLSPVIENDNLTGQERESWSRDDNEKAFIYALLWFAGVVGVSQLVGLFAGMSESDRDNFTRTTTCFAGPAISLVGGVATQSMVKLVRQMQG